MTNIDNIAVLGAGLMGHGIAQIASQIGGFEVRLYARNTLDKGFGMMLKSLETFEKKKQLTKAEVRDILARIHRASSLREAILGADFIIESIPENIEEKEALFKQIDKFAQSNTIIVSGTSSIKITTLASALSRPENFCGMHFFNPPQLMKLVEVIKGEKTSSRTIQTVLDIAHKMGKETVLVKKDSPGFIVNRILLPALNEAANMYFEGVACRDDIDKAVKLGLNWPMGPLMVADYIGEDTVLAILNILENDLPHDFQNSKGLEELVKANRLGRKTGRGFYDWPDKYSARR